MSIESAPDWAEGSGAGLPGTVRPRPGRVRVVRARGRPALQRDFGGLPRVRHWQAWNEPNYFRHLARSTTRRGSSRCRTSSRLLSPDIYRAMLNAFTGASTACGRQRGGRRRPVAVRQRERRDARGAHAAVHASVLCLPRPTGRYAAAPGALRRLGAPAVHRRWALPSQPRAQDVSLGDLPKMKRVLDAGVRTGHVRSRGRVKFWVTEFSWDSESAGHQRRAHELADALGPRGLLPDVAERRELVTWFQIRDDTGVIAGRVSSSSRACTSAARAGIECDTPKPFVQSFRFPLVAYPAARAG